MRYWKEISSEKYNEMLGCLPPEKWEMVDGVDIFRLCEYSTKTTTAYYAKYSEKDAYFTTVAKVAGADYKEMAEEVKGAYKRVCKSHNYRGSKITPIRGLDEMVYQELVRRARNAGKRVGPYLSGILERHFAKFPEQ